MTAARVVLRNGQVELEQTSHQQLAVRAALHGNWKPADSMELDRLCRTVWPHTREGEAPDFPNLVPVEILRGAGPAGEDCARWTFDLPCGKCEGEGVVSYEDEDDDFACVTESCSRCEGTGVDAEEFGSLITNLQGLILRDDLP